MEKINFKNISRELTREEMKNIMAGDCQEPETIHINCDNCGDYIHYDMACMYCGDWQETQDCIDEVHDLWLDCCARCGYSSCGAST